MHWLIKYVTGLLAIWFNWLLLAAGIISAILLMVESFYPALSLPAWFSWILVAVIIFCFLGANVRLFANLEIEKRHLLERITELEAVQAKLQITCQHFGFGPSRSQDSRQFREREIDPYGYDKDGLLDCAGVWADIEIENVGYKPGELVIGLDDSSTKLPGIFAIDENTTIQFHGGPPTQIGGQARLPKQIMLDFTIKERNPQAFARALQTPQTYKIVLKYCTRRIGSTSEEESLVIGGNLENFREKVIKYWEGFGFGELAEIAECRPESEKQ
jgi:hypothetical protein